MWAKEVSVTTPATPREYLNPKMVAALRNESQRRRLERLLCFALVESGLGVDAIDRVLSVYKSATAEAQAKGIDLDSSEST